MEFIIGSYILFCGHTWLCLDGDKIYALKSLENDSALLAYNAPDLLPKDGGSLTLPTEGQPLASECTTTGKHSCHITILKNQAVVADYSSGTLSVFELDGAGVPTGKLKVLEFPTRVASTPQEDAAIDHSRQKGPHIHSSWVSPDRQNLVVVDLGSDRLYRFSIDPEKGNINTDKPYESLSLPTGCGPRHCAFGKSAEGKTMLYVATELSDEVLVYSWPEMSLLQRCNANSAKPGGGSHIVIGPDGGHLYMSCRLRNDGIAIFSIGPDGLLTKAGYQSTGAHPRHFSISRDGSSLAVACRDSDLIQVFTIDRSSGMLELSKEIVAHKPVYVDFLSK